MASQIGDTLIFVLSCLIGIVFVLTVAFCNSFFVIPGYPETSLKNLSVSNFNASFPGFTANWEAKVKIRNPTWMFGTKFDGIKASLYYEKDFLIASGFAQPLSLKAGKSKEIQINLSAKDSDLGKTGKWVVAKMAKERETNGSVTVMWTMELPTKYTWWFLKSSRDREFDCEYVRVLLGETANGSAMSQDLRKCQY